jgi:hypothetical protein
MRAQGESANRPHALPNVQLLSLPSTGVDYRVPQFASWSPSAKKIGSRSLSHW